MKIYTRTGDEGETGLFAGPRVAKDHARIEAYGEVDELNAFLGMARCESLPSDVDRLIEQIQNDLFALGADLASPQATKHGFQFEAQARVSNMEQTIDKLEIELEPLKQFILPGGCRSAAILHVARTVCRRAERGVVRLLHSPNETVSNDVLRYLNRLSDLLFILARVANAREKIIDVPWQA